MRLNLKKIVRLSPLLVLMASLFLAMPAVKADYDAAYLVSDDLFTDAGSMSVNSIQSFLSSKGSSLATYKTTEDCGSTSGSHYSYYATYYHCGKTESAATIIYDAAHAYSISPRTIMATLQKEQSLITDPSPSSSQINCAMGYNSCSGFRGFFSQVDNGTWQFRVYIELMNGRSYWGYDASSYPCSAATSLYNNGLYPGNSVRFADPGGTAKTITLYNSATAALYCYTPYVGPYSETGYSGSYNFVTSWESWWGSTKSNPIKVLVKDSQTSEGGATAKVEFALADEPSADVTIPLAVSDTSEGTLNGVSSITITASTWDSFSSNVVTITGVDDNIPDGDVPYTLIAGHPSSTDPAYANLSSAETPNAALVNKDNEVFAYGRTTDKPLVGDWNGDGKDTAGIFRDGYFYLDNNDDGITDTVVRLGRGSDTPLVGDWTGSGHDSVGVWRAGMFYLDNNNDGVADTAIRFGKTTDTPIVGDWNGNGTDSIGVRRDSNKTFYMDNNNDGVADLSSTFGKSTDTPIVGDWNGNNTDAPGVWRGDIRTFYLSD
ncbi:MAG TPA: hypothetical protein VG964_03040 [Candidatus Saccharimonadales bacterium]|nr:hypothetical protein [Candidatus Saccharimonadales bacterium]